MTNYLKVVRIERDPGEKDEFAIWVTENGVERIWLYTDNPDEYKVGHTYED